MSHAEALASVERGDFAQGLRQARAALVQSPQEAGPILLTIAWIELDRGNFRACARELAKAGANGASAARVKCLNGLRLCAIGDYEHAVTELSGALRNLLGDRKWLANALVGRGIARGYLFRLTAADRDFAVAARILGELGEHERVAACVHNRGFVALQKGDLPRALELFEHAGKGLRFGRAEALIDHASALLAAGMTRDASALLEQAESLLAGRGSRLAEAVLNAGYCALYSGDIDLAACAAKRAHELFRMQRRPAWVAVADALALRTQLPDAAAARRVADRCFRWGRRIEAAELLLAAAKVAPQLLVKLEGERTASTARLRAIGWLARAMRSEGQARFAACRAGMRVVTEYAGAMGVGARELAAEFSGVAIAHAKRPSTVFSWMERQRITVLPQVNVGDLVALRDAEAQGDTARVAELEARMRRLPSTSAHADAIDELREALGDRMLISFTVHNGETIACTLTRSRVRVHRLGSVGTPGFSWEPRPANAADNRILRPLGIGDRELVIVPAEGMSGLVWAALPSCVGRPVSVVPSAATWLRAVRSRNGQGRVAVAGPGLRHAEREVAGLGYAVVESKVATVLAAVEGADIVHIAAHGKFRADAPMFSCLRLTDGPLYGYDLARLNRAPRLLVLSACEVAKAELFATALFDRGGQALIASSIPVPDERAVDLMATLHRRLGQGESPAAALAEAQVRHGHLGFSCLGAG
ncbi:tetratricopeptide (TPR) repeat protein [Kibdelosporangium banguiense]|uniref:Tetratricopeptide (TPR) repeat protein n=1 Tax=Kibdelosporangium banguiense TaxID=1365924 RepID=A0ABS4TD51_9PSEU|nr:CHAT domain-containing protein [Kibdelosporangium banguiense]MBP2322266.1 tetratricopeptide (TPR) repeat protein [Kibdelosporangium banguiense]